MKHQTFTRLLYVLSFTLVFNQFLFAQTTSVKITVVDASSNATISGASAIIKGSKTGASSNQDGILNIVAKPGDVLEISHLGYLAETVTVTDSPEITVKLIFSSVTLPDVVLVGTRTAGRVKMETPVPVDVVNLKQVSMPTARMDLTSMINYAAPSLNYNKQSGSDGADHIDLATLRGLGPDQTLVLINGKRRHQTAFIAVFGTRGRGNSGTDLNAIPISSIEKVEILRDGASAQYGSDAIAGVINLVLKKNTGELTADAGYSGYYDKKYNPYFKKELNQYIYDKALDGITFNLNANYGIPVGKKGGFVNFTGTFTDQGKTFRQVLDTANYNTDINVLPTNISRRAHGDGSLKGGGGFFNSEFPLKENGTTIYAFGGANFKSSDAYAFTRNFSARPDRFPTDVNGNLIFVPDIMEVSSDGLFASADTFYNPHIQTKVRDLSLAAGVKGTMKNNWDWDISNNIGTNNFHFYGDKTFNASLGPDQTHFDDGGFSFTQNTVNLNFNKPISGIAEGFNFATGAEYRYEMYKLFAGEAGSYTNYDDTKATGSQGFPGYQPSDAVNANRSTVGVYVDAEMDVTKKWLLTGAIRAENYSDFGFTHNYKLSTRYKVTDNFNLRGSVSTGFRAPSLQQINFSSTFTTVQGGNIAEVKIAPNDNVITKAAGIPDLKQEKSINASVGFTFKPSDNFNITIDGYWVQIKDRVVLSGQFDATDNTLDPVLLNALNDLKVSLAQFFCNAVNTTNKGIDLVFDYKKTWNKNTFKAMLTGNVQKMEINNINVPAKLDDTKQHRQTFLNDREQKFILASAPGAKFGLNLEYGIHNFSIGTRVTYFGKITILGYGEDGLGINPMVPSDADGTLVPDQYIYNGKFVSDLYFSYKFCKNLTGFVGADNIFNVHPDLGAVAAARGWAFNNETGGPWDAVQMGGNGTHFFVRLGFNF